MTKTDNRFLDFENLTPNVKPSMVSEFPENSAVKPNTVSVSSQTEIKNDSLQIAWTEIHNIELDEKKLWTTTRDID